MKNLLFAPTLVAILSMCSVSQCQDFSAFSKLESTKSASTRSFTEPYRSIEVAATEMGTLASLSVVEGDLVEAGQVLANLNEDVLARSLEIAIQAQKSQGKLNTALAELEIQQDRLNKIVELASRNHASQIELKRASGQLKVASARVQTVKDELRLKSIEVGKIEAQLEQRRLRSPISGVVTQVLKDEGEFVSANEPVVVRVVQLDQLKVVFLVPQDQINDLKTGQQVSVAIGHDKRQANGTVEFVSPTSDAQSETRRVKVRIPNEKRQWQSGLVCVLENPATENKQNAVTKVREKGSLVVLGVGNPASK